MKNNIQTKLGVLKKLFSKSIKLTLSSYNIDGRLLFRFKNGCNLFFKALKWDNCYGIKTIVTGRMRECLVRIALSQETQTNFDIPGIVVEREKEREGYLEGLGQK